VDLGLKDKVAVITGGNTGIGLAIAAGLAHEKAHVVLCARNEATTVEQAQHLRQEYGVEALGLPCDVTHPEDIARVVAAVEQTFGGTDILINNAGAGTNETIMDAPDEKWQYYWELHVMAAVRLSRALVPAMRRRGGGVILNNASICATQPLGHDNELIPDNIRVNCINPGLILTAGWTDHAKQIAPDWQAYLDGIARENAPIGRFATPEELADFFVFLCSPRASYCVGSTYYVDGGWLKVIT
jgi:NAD(P)-dependent dehydrogenase (short-subunit alcohol dehydrogenase family)